MSDFQWKESHIEWCFETFRYREKELSAGDIEKRYRPKNGEPRKGKPKGDEQTICKQDFRNLMRLMVVNKFARVTCCHSKDINYRIRFVSNSYQYTQEIFDEIIFQQHAQGLIIPTFDMLINHVKHHPIGLSTNNLIESTSEIVLRQAWESMMIVGGKIIDTFYTLNYLGGDFDSILDDIERWDPYLAWDTKEYMYFKKDFIMEVGYLAALYKVCKIGSDYFIRSVGWIKTVEFDNSYLLFCKIFTSSLMCKFFYVMDNDRIIVSNRTQSNNYPGVVNALMNGDYQYIKNSSYAQRSMAMNEESLYWTDMWLWSEFMKVLKTSNNIEIKKAFQDCENAYYLMLNSRTTYLNTYR
jgi:hypothetical protein